MKVRVGATPTPARETRALPSALRLYGTRKILSVRGSFTLVPGANPLTSTYLSLAKGLNTYPGLSGTAFAVGKFYCGAEGRDKPAFVEDCAVSLRVVRGTSLDLRLWRRSAPVWGDIGWPGWITSDEVASVVPTIVG